MSELVQCLACAEEGVGQVMIRIHSTIIRHHISNLPCIHHPSSSINPSSTPHPSSTNPSSSHHPHIILQPIFCSSLNINHHQFIICPSTIISTNSSSVIHQSFIKNPSFTHHPSFINNPLSFIIIYLATINQDDARIHSSVFNHHLSITHHHSLTYIFHQSIIHP